MPKTRWNNALYYIHNKYFIIMPSIMEACFIIFKTALRYNKIELTIITFCKICYMGYFTGTYRKDVYPKWHSMTTSTFLILYT